MINLLTKCNVKKKRLQIGLTSTTLRDILRRLSIYTSLIPSLNLMTRERTRARLNIQPRILNKKVIRPQNQTNTLRRHKREILRTREMRQSKGVPQHHIGILDIAGGGILDPLRESHGGLSAGLRDVFAGGVDLVFGVGGDVDCVAGESASFPDETAFFRHQARDFSGDEFVADGCPCCGMDSTSQICRQMSHLLGLMIPHDRPVSEL